MIPGGGSSGKNESIDDVKKKDFFHDGEHVETSFFFRLGR